jgi:hypothetical protein
MHRKIDIAKEGGVFLNALYQGPSPQPHSHWTQYRSNFQEGTLELEGAAIGLLKLVDERVGRDPTSTVAPDLPVSDTGQTVLHLSASLGFARLLQELIVRRVNLDQRDFNGNTALHFAALHGHMDCTRFLVNGGADPAIINKHGRTALEIALESNYHTVVEFLEMDIKAGANVRDPGNEQRDGKDGASQGALDPGPTISSTSRSPPGNRMTSQLPALMMFPPLADLSPPEYALVAADEVHMAYSPLSSGADRRTPKEFSPAEGTSNRIAWWLVPNAPSAKTLQSAIKKAAAPHNSPTFPPHVTLFSLKNTDKTVEEFAKVTQAVIDEVKAPISLEEAGVQVGETFHQSVYLALKPTDELTILRANLLEAVGAPADTESPAFPHASLYYGEGSKEDKHHVVAQMLDACAVDIRHDGLIEVTGLESRLELTEVWIVNIATAQPADWEVLHKLALSGAEVAPSLLASPVSRKGTGETTFSSNDSPTVPIPLSPAVPPVGSSTYGSTAVDESTPPPPRPDLPTSR